MLLGVVVVTLQAVVDGLVHLVGDAHLFLARWSDAVASEEHDDAVGGIDGFADDVVFVLLVGATGAIVLLVIPVDEVLVHNCLNLNYYR